MISEHDLAAAVFSEFFFVGEFAFRDPPPPLFVANRRRYDSPAVEPVFDPISANDDSSRIPFSGWFQHPLSRRLIKVIECAGALAIKGPAFLFIANLVLQAKRLLAILAHAIFETAVAPDSDLPLKRQLEVANPGSSNDVAAPPSRSI